MGLRRVSAALLLAAGAHGLAQEPPQEGSLLRSPRIQDSQQLACQLAVDAVNDHGFHVLIVLERSSQRGKCARERRPSRVSRCLGVVLAPLDRSA